MPRDPVRDRRAPGDHRARSRRALGRGAAALVGVLATTGVVDTGDAAPATRITICHATGDGSWISVTPSASAAIAGHGHHGRDVIPAFTYERGRETIHFGGLNLGAIGPAGQTGQAILAAGCRLPAAEPIPPDTEATTTPAPTTATTPPPTAAPATAAPSTASPPTPVSTTSVAPPTAASTTVAVPPTPSTAAPSTAATTTVVPPTAASTTVAVPTSATTVAPSTIATTTAVPTPTAPTTVPVPPTATTQVPSPTDPPRSTTTPAPTIPTTVPVPPTATTAVPSPTASTTAPVPPSVTTAVPSPTDAAPSTTSPVPPVPTTSVVPGVAPVPVVDCLTTRDDGVTVVWFDYVFAGDAPVRIEWGPDNALAPRGLPPRLFAPGRHLHVVSVETLGESASWTLLGTVARSGPGTRACGDDGTPGVPSTEPGGTDVAGTTTPTTAGTSTPTSDVADTSVPSTEPGATEPAATDPGGTEPAATDPGGTEPTSSDPVGTEPAATGPGVTEPSPTDPGATTTTGTAPGSTDPASTDAPGATDPASTDAPGPTDPASTDAPGSTDGGPTDGPAVEPVRLSLIDNVMRCDGSAVATFAALNPNEFELGGDGFTSELSPPRLDGVQPTLISTRRVTTDRGVEVSETFSIDYVTAVTWTVTHDGATASVSAGVDGARDEPGCPLARLDATGVDGTLPPGRAVPVTGSPLTWPLGLAGLLVGLLGLSLVSASRRPEPAPDEGSERLAAAGVGPAADVHTPETGDT